MEARTDLLRTRQSRHHRRTTGRRPARRLRWYGTRSWPTCRCGLLLLCELQHTMRLHLSGPLSRKRFSVYQSSSLQVVPISPNEWVVPRMAVRVRTRTRKLSYPAEGGRPSAAAVLVVLPSRVLSQDLYQLPVHPRIPKRRSVDTISCPRLAYRINLEM